MFYNNKNLHQHQAKLHMHQRTLIEMKEEGEENLDV
jgi:hypothetical protein